jgi:hypothetical protein
MLLMAGNKLDSGYRFCYFCMQRVSNRYGFLGAPEAVLCYWVLMGVLFGRGWGGAGKRGLEFRKS